MLQSLSPARHLCWRRLQVSHPGAFIPPLLWSWLWLQAVDERSCWYYTKLPLTSQGLITCCTMDTQRCYHGGVKQGQPISPNHPRDRTWQYGVNIRRQKSWKKFILHWPLWSESTQVILERMEWNYKSMVLEGSKKIHSLQIGETVLSSGLESRATPTQWLDWRSQAHRQHHHSMQTPGTTGANHFPNLKA